VRVFGSVARGQDTADSDVDLLVDLAPGTGLLGLGRLEHDLNELLGIRVDLVPADDLNPDVAREVLLGPWRCDPLRNSAAARHPGRAERDRRAPPSGTPADGQVFDAAEVRLIEIGQAGKHLPAQLLAS